MRSFLKIMYHENVSSIIIIITWNFLLIFLYFLKAPKLHVTNVIDGIWGQHASII